MAAADPDPAGLYAALGVGRDASADDVRRAYRRLALRLHPDKLARGAAASSSTDGGAADPTTSPTAPDDGGEAFRRVTAAYEVLSDAARRELYDRTGATSTAPPPPPPGPFAGGGAGAMPFFGAGAMPGLFANLFGGGGVGGRPGRGSAMGGQAAQGPGPLLVEVDVSALEVARGCVKSVEFEALDGCGACRGTGCARPEDLVTCMACGGSGEGLRQLGPFVMAAGPCGACGGEGACSRSGRQCGACEGKRAVFRRRVITVTVPRGVPPGLTVRVQGKGPLDARTQQHGDAMLRFRWAAAPATADDGAAEEDGPPPPVIDPVTGRVDVAVRVPLSDVLCGFRRRLDVLGETIELVGGGGGGGYAALPPEVRVPGGGVPLMGRPADAPPPDLVVRLSVAWPRDGSDAAAALRKYRDVLAKMLGVPLLRSDAETTPASTSDAAPSSVDGGYTARRVGGG